ncbi:PadR family transcriptional regulator [Kribbella sp. NBC_00662]|uniref:PadR family transcriptional regulator n=1 Tax=Kribbella sp. NBC_00662 TaxID=2975969 RepID=UPI00324E2CDC
MFLAVLADESRHGYEIRQTLGQEFGELLPAMNAGQIYSTLARIERDGLVVGQSVEGDGRRKRMYELTEAGQRREYLRSLWNLDTTLVADGNQVVAELLVERAILDLKALP